MAMLLKVVLSGGNRADGVIAFCLCLINFSFAMLDRTREKGEIEPRVLLV